MSSSDKPQCQWEGCSRDAATRIGSKGPHPRYCGQDGHTAAAAAEAKRAAKRAAGRAAAARSAAGARALAGNLPPEGQVRQTVAAWAEAMAAQQESLMTSLDLLDEAAGALRNWQDDTAVEQRLTQAARDVADASRRVQDADSRVQRMEADMQAAQEEAKQKIEAAATVQAEAQQAIEQAKEQIHHAEAARRAAVEERDQARQAQAAAEARATGAEADLDRTRAAEQAARGEARDAERRASELNGELGQVKSALDHANETGRQAAHDLGAAQARIAELERHLAAATGKKAK